MTLEEYAKQFKIIEEVFKEAPWTVNVWKKGCTDSVYYKASCWNGNVSEGSLTGIGDTPDEAVLDAIQLSYYYDYEKKLNESQE